jgi:hypothetical protein
MRFMMLYKPGKDEDAPPTQQEIEEMGRFIGEMASEGVLLFTDGLQASSKGAKVRVSNGKFTVTDGPFTETKELIAGFAIVQARSKEHAIELAKRFLAVVGEGESEIRLMHDQPAFDAGSSAEPERAGQGARR